MINHLLPPILSLQPEERKTMLRQETANIALKKYPGRVVRVKTVQQRNSPAFCAKNLSKVGNVHIIMIDATNRPWISRR